MKIPAPAKAGTMVVTLHRREESRGTTVPHQQEQHRPAKEVQTLWVWHPFPQKRGRASAAQRSPWSLGQDPSPQREEELGPVDLWASPWSQSPWKWCPLHEMSLHDVMACRHIGHLVEIHREHLAKSAAEGVTHGYHECGQAGHWSRSCPGKIPTSEGPGSTRGGLVGARPGRNAHCGLLGRAL
jgi:hypothetical protein